MRFLTVIATLSLLGAAFSACGGSDPAGLAPAASGTGPQVKFDWFAKPNPEIPLPNDLACRADATSPTGLRVNASHVAPTTMERAAREELGMLDGWGTFAPITIPFTAPLDVSVIVDRHRDRYDFQNDAVLVIDITPGSPSYGEAAPLDFGEGNFPAALHEQRLFVDDPRDSNLSLQFEEVDEDLNGDGVLQLEEDTDWDNVLDRANFLPGTDNALDGLMTFYEHETNTLIARPLVPLRDETRYAVVVTTRLTGTDGAPVRSSFPYINHTQQTEVLRPLVEVLPRYGLTLDDVAFTWAFTTQSITRPFRAIRDGLYGYGPMAWLHEEFPDRLSHLYQVKDFGADVHVVRSEEWVPLLEQIAEQILGLDPSDPLYTSLIESQQYVDYHVVGSFYSPQFFPRMGRRDPGTGELVPTLDAEPNDNDPDLEMLPLEQQTWRLDPLTGEAFVRPEKVTFWMVVPREEVAPRPTPIALIGHGYMSAKIDPMIYGGFLAQFGVSSVGIESVSHGIPVGQVEEAILYGLFKAEGLGGMAEAVLNDRAFDMNGDTTRDSGADFWTAYSFHTRDLLRQSAVDYLQFVRILRSFDGIRPWDFETAEHGPTGLAGDFDGDGVVDAGGPSVPFYMSGGSLGGIMTGIVAGIEPELTAAAPISGAGGVGDVGYRTTNPGVPEAVVLRAMGPIFYPKRSDAGKLELHQVVPDLTNMADLAVAPLEEPDPGDTVVIENLDNGEVGCARVQDSGHFRVAVASDRGHRLRLAVYPGLALSGVDRCALVDDATPRTVVDAFGDRVRFQNQKHEEGDPLVALGDGLGLRRGTPELRRLFGLGQTILDAADPGNFAPYYEERTLTFADGSQPRPRVLIVATAGDLDVPVASSVALARNAGFVEYRQVDDRWGTTVNEVLIDNYVIEGSAGLKRYADTEGNGVLLDVENLSEGTDGWDVPRLDPPLHQVNPSAHGGYSGFILPLVVPQGMHAFDLPGALTPAGFDTGRYMLNFVGRYLTTNGTDYTFDLCLARNDCDFIPPPPPPR